MAGMYVVKYKGNIVAGPFNNGYDAQRAQARLYQESGCIPLADFEITFE
jgi:hypothetical protein